MDDRPIGDHGYQLFLDEDKLMGSRCSACKAIFVPPRQICVECRGHDLAWASVRGTGRLAAFTSISIGPSFMSEEGFGRDRPYCTAAVELDEGPRVVARLEEVEPSRPDQICIGMPVTVRFLHRTTTSGPRTFLAFVPC